MTYSSLSYSGTLANLTLSRKPHRWLHQGWFFSGEQKHRETSSRKTVNGEMYANLPYEYIHKSLLPSHVTLYYWNSWNVISRETVM